MIRPGDREKVRAYFDAQTARGFGVTAGQVCDQPGLGGRYRRRTSAAEARLILDGLVADGVATAAWEWSRHGGPRMWLYRAAAATTAATTPANPPRESARAAPSASVAPAASGASRRTRGAGRDG